MSYYRVKNNVFDLALLAFKRNYLMKLLKKNENNILEVSRQTELSRNTIYKIIGVTKAQLKKGAY